MISSAPCWPQARDIKHEDLKETPQLETAVTKAPFLMRGNMTCKLNLVMVYASEKDGWQGAFQYFQFPHIAIVIIFLAEAIV